MVVSQEKACGAQFYCSCYDWSGPARNLPAVPDRDQFFANVAGITINKDRVQFLMRLSPHFHREVFFQGRVFRPHRRTDDRFAQRRLDKVPRGNNLQSDFLGLCAGFEDLLAGSGKRPIKAAEMVEQLRCYLGGT